MKKQFPGHFPPTNASIKKIWNSCIFTFDANILLNLYRYSESTRKDFIQIIENIKDRIWLSYRAAEEYFDNRLDVIYQQEKAYNDTLKALKNIQRDLKNPRQHPFISEELMSRISDLIDEISSEFNTNKEIHVNRRQKDNIKNILSKLFSNKIGGPFKDGELENICKIAADRYLKRIPPGFKDKNKPEDDSKPSSYRKFGDYIIWKQIINKSNKDNVDIILVLDDRKADWWQIFKEKTLGPRPELIAEFKSETSNNFYMYKPDIFLEYAAKYFKQKIDPDSIGEVRELRDQDIDLIKHQMNDEIRSKENIATRLVNIDEKLNHLSNRRIELKDKLLELQSSLTKSHKYSDFLKSREISDRLKHIEDRFDYYINRRNELVSYYYTQNDKNSL